MGFLLWFGWFLFDLDWWKEEMERWLKIDANIKSYLIKCILWGILKKERFLRKLTLNIKLIIIKVTYNLISSNHFSKMSYNLHKFFLPLHQTNKIYVWWKLGEKENKIKDTKLKNSRSKDSKINWTNIAFEHCQEKDPPFRSDNRNYAAKTHEK